LPNDGLPQSPEPFLGPFLASPCAPAAGMIAGHMTKLIINGAKGRMGQTLISCAARLPDLQVVAGTDVGDNLAALLPGCDAVIDFTLHYVTADVASLCAAHGKALVIGTTGHSEAEKAVIRAAAAKIPMVWATNFSTGVNTLFWLTRKAAEILG
jgi:4-hydroxy-tetrahydrodipicolinate reductase